MWKVSRSDSRWSAGELRRSPLALGVAAVFGSLPEFVRPIALSFVWRLEGGQFTSSTARRLLSSFYGVDVGAFSYGSLMVPGMAQPGTRIGRYVSVGPNVRRYGASHPMDALSLHPYWYNPALRVVGPESDVPRSSLEICDDAWIGANVVILQGCSRIGVGAVVGAGAIVTRDVEDFSVVVGVPAQEVRKRLTPEVRTELLRLAPWRFSPSECAAILRGVRDRHDE